MKLQELKQELLNLNEIKFQMENGTTIPPHFHLTEIGAVTKHFIDCGGTERIEKSANLQLWYANDTEHRLTPKKLIDIIQLSEQKLQIGNLEIEIEYQAETIGKYKLKFENGNFVLLNKYTDCLASDSCGIPQEKRKVKLSELSEVKSSCCTPGGGCC